MLTLSFTYRQATEMRGVSLIEALGIGFRRIAYCSRTSLNFGVRTRPCIRYIHQQLPAVVVDLLLIPIEVPSSKPPGKFLEVRRMNLEKKWSLLQPSLFMDQDLISQQEICNQFTDKSMIGIEH